VEPTLAEVLILNDLGEGGFDKVVNYVGRRMLGEFEGLRGGDA
jgi:hypothetical protein